MEKRRYKRIFYLALVCFALGAVFSITLKEITGSLGTVFIGLGGLFLISSMAAKKKFYDNNKK